jgi:hypothetical protein
MTKTSAFIRIALAYCAAATSFAGCNGPQAATIPAGGSFSELEAAVPGHNQRSGNAAMTDENLVYLSYGSCSSHIKSACAAEVVVYTFPGGQPIGTWYSAGYALGECADEAGNIFVTYINSGSIGEILKFAHGGTSPVATLSDPTGMPETCSVDRISGDLAVVNGAGTLLIYSNASGSPTTYSLPGVYFYSVSYDNKGNVFVDGLTGSNSSQFVLAKLPKGGNSFENITLNKQVDGARELDWQGKYLTIGPEYLGQGEIYRFDIRGSSGHFVGATPLKRIRGGVDQYWIVGKQIVVAYSWKPCHAICDDEGTVGIWSYPSGRVITKRFTPYGAPSTGMALSLAQNRR